MFRDKRDVEGPIERGTPYGRTGRGLSNILRAKGGIRVILCRSLCIIPFAHIITYIWIRGRRRRTNGAKQRKGARRTRSEARGVCENLLMRRRGPEGTASLYVYHLSSLSHHPPPNIPPFQLPLPYTFTDKWPPMSKCQTLNLSSTWEEFNLQESSTKNLLINRFPLLTATPSSPQTKSPSSSLY